MCMVSTAQIKKSIMKLKSLINFFSWQISQMKISHDKKGVLGKTKIHG